MTKVTQAHIDARTKDILDAAQRMFVRKGVEAATMQEIAAEAGLSAGAIYRYYASKEHLLRAVCGNWLEHDRALFEQAAAASESPLEAILRVGRTVWDEMKTAQAREDTILTLETVLAATREPEELGAERRQMWTDVADMVEGFLRQAQASGEIDREIDPRALAVMLLACAFGTRLLALELEDTVDTDAVFVILTEMLGRSARRPE